MKQKLTAGLIALFLLCALQSISAQQELRLMSYNIRNGIGMDNITSLQRTAAVLTAGRADVIALQEIDSMTNRSEQTDVLQELASLTGLYPLYAPAIDYDGGKYGIGMLSREKPLSWQAFSLPGREEERALLLAEFDHFVFGCTHLSLTEADRMASLALLDSIVQVLDKPLFLAGDLNAEPDSPFIRALQQNYTVLTDMSQPTFPATQPRETIDYIIADKQAAPAFRLIRSFVVDEPLASDHRPICVDIELVN